MGKEEHIFAHNASSTLLIKIESCPFPPYTIKSKYLLMDGEKAALYMLMCKKQKTSLSENQEQDLVQEGTDFFSRAPDRRL